MNNHPEISVKLQQLSASINSLIEVSEFVKEVHYSPDLLRNCSTFEMESEQINYFNITQDFAKSLTNVMKEFILSDINAVIECIQNMQKHIENFSVI